MDAAKVSETAQQAAHGIQQNLAQGLGRVQKQVEENVRRGAEQARGVASSLNEEFGSFVRESPVIALGGAFAVGYLIAKIARAFR